MMTIKMPKEKTVGGAWNNYDPYQHREITNTNNNLDTLIYLLKCSLGTGMLAMPQAFARVGLGTATVGIILAGMLVTYCMHVLFRAQLLMCRHRREPFLSYESSMAEALQMGLAPRHVDTPTAICFLDVCLLVYQLGICCVYILFILSHIKQVMDPVYELPMSRHITLLMVTLMAFSLIPSLKAMIPFSAVANALMILGLAFVILYLMGATPSSQKLVMWGSVETLPLFLGTVLFALTSAGVLVKLQSHMATPHDFVKPCGVLNTGMAVVVLVYVAVGTLGYAHCGAYCKDSITLNMSAGPLTNNVYLMFLLAIYVGYVLQSFPSADIICSYVQPFLSAKVPTWMRHFGRVGVLVALCLANFSVALGSPQLGLFTAMVGALCVPVLSICIPVMMEACLVFPHRHISKKVHVTLFKDGLLFALGLIIMVAGTSQALAAIEVSPNED